MIPRIARLLGILAALAVGNTAQAVVAQRTFVATYGNDAHPCSITQPCRGFAAAIGRTAAGGEVIVLDSGGYGTVTITKSVSIIAAPGVYAGISVFSGGFGVTVNADDTDVVALRGLTIISEGGELAINVTQVGGLIVDRCVVTGFLPITRDAIDVRSANEVSIIDTTIANSGTAIAVIASGRPSPTQISIHNSAFLHDFSALVFNGNIGGEIDGSVLTSIGPATGTSVFVFDGPLEFHIANTTVRGFDVGVEISVVRTYASVSISHSELTNNRVAASANNGGLFAMEGNRIVHNSQGLELLGTGVAFSAGENYFAFNVSDGAAFTATAGVK